MSVGLLALLDDVAGLAKVAAASLDDIVGQASRAGLKAAGAVIDDAAVTPRYLQGFAAVRELPIVGKIAIGSIRNKLLILLPALLLLSFFAPWMVNPLLMLGGAYLCYEGAEKVYEAVFPHEAHAHEAHLEPIALNAQSLEDKKIAGAIQTDFILSAEIMTIALAALPVGGGLLNQALVLAVVAIGITVAVYGGVALIVKADDFGLWLAQSRQASVLGAALRAIGRGLVKGMPVFMRVLAVVGTAAMIWVGGGILTHGLAGFGLPFIAHTVEELAHAAATAVPAAHGLVDWVVNAIGSGIFGLFVGLALIPVVERVLAPAWGWVKRLRSS
jgi:predicted DNA repair protein MutK